MNTNILLVFLFVILFLVLIALFVWRFVFKRSIRKMVMTFLGLLIENTTDAHKGEPIEMDTSEHKSDIIKAKAEAVNFEEALASAKPVEIQKAVIPPEERGELARDTSDNGWPRELDDETRRDPRPFLDVHLRTETVSTVSQSEDKADREVDSDSLAD